MKVAQTQNNVSLRTLKFQTRHVFPIEGRSPLVSLTLRAFNDDFSPCKTCIINYMQEKEVLYFNQLLIESETPQRSVCHHLDVTCIFLFLKYTLQAACTFISSYIAGYDITHEQREKVAIIIMKPSDTMWLKGYQCWIMMMPCRFSYYIII